MEKLLKDRRGQTGLPLSEIARMTRIKESYLKAVEEEEFETLPIEVYTRGYIREYARFLGVSPEEALGPYERHLELRRSAAQRAPAKSSRAAAQAPAEASTGPRTGSVQPQRSGSPAPAGAPVLRKLLSHRRVAWVLPAILGVLIIYSALPSRKEVARPTLKVEEAVPAKTDQTPAVPAENAAGPTAESQTPQPLAVRESFQGQGAPHRLDIVATDKVWLQVVIDGSEKRDMLLSRGDRVSYTAASNFTLKIGNAAGLRFVFDQREFDNLGSKGQVIRVSLPENSPDLSLPKKNHLGDRIITPSEASPP